jgi:CelD/BcsL family acetyltransferase involved in cellulose biosynthesis
MTALEVRPVPFKFQVGERTLWSVSIPLQMHPLSLREGLAGNIDAEPAPGDLAPGSQGIGLRAVPIAGPQPRVTVTPAYIRYVQNQYRRYYIDLRIGWEAYKGKFSSKTRSTITRKVSRYAAHSGGSVCWRAFRQPGEMAEFHGLARVVSARTYQEKLLDAGLPEGAEFVAEMQDLAQRDEVRAYVLFDGERPVSYLYCPVQDGALIYAYLGYDPDYLKLSVGTVLQWLALESIFAEGCFEFFDFTEGQSDHKRLFATHDIECANIYFIRRNAWNRLVVQGHRGFDRLVEAAGDAAERMGLKARLKRVLRSGLFSRPKSEPA